MCQNLRWKWLKFAVEMVKVEPVSSLFSKQTSFSHHFNHKEFELVSKSTGLTLGDLLKFIPLCCEMEEMLVIDKEDRKKRASVQTQAMDTFFLL